MRRISRLTLGVATVFALVTGASMARADGDISKLGHVIVLMQENHSFDNYFGALAYAPSSPYHSPRRDCERDGDHGCAPNDHDCVDGLTCVSEDTGGDPVCFNANPDDSGPMVRAFHDTRRCVAPDLDHGWVSSHREANFSSPNDALRSSPNDGFVRVNDQTEQLDIGVESATEDQTMNFYDQNEIPFYYDLAEKFAIDDRYFCSVLGPTFPNRSYLMAATSFGHLTTNDIVPPAGGYKPVHGTIFDLMDNQAVTWADYFQDVPQGGSFRVFSATAIDPHFLPLSVFLAQLAGVAAAGPLPEVSFVDPNFGFFTPKTENDEHPPTDIQRGQAFVSTVVNALRNGPHWSDSALFITYDEHGGSYDHVKPPRARQGGQSTPDGVAPGQCEDLSNAPASLQPGGGAQCSSNQLSSTGTSVNTAIELCPALATDPTGLFPPACASFDQLGFRVPFIAVSAFAKPHYVSHTIGDHTSLLALIEKRFMGGAGDDDGRPHLTERDLHADPLEDLFDFDRSPSLHTPVTQAAPPANDCTP